MTRPRWILSYAYSQNQDLIVANEIAMYAGQSDCVFEAKSTGDVCRSEPHFSRRDQIAFEQRSVQVGCSGTKTPSRLERTRTEPDTAESQC